MTLRLPSLNKKTPLRTALLLTALFFLLLSQNTFAQTDADSLVLKRPTKVFKAFGKRWQRNGHNYSFVYSKYKYSKAYNIEDYLNMVPDTTILNRYANDKSKNVKTDYLYGTPYAYGVDFSVSYEMLPEKTSASQKELRFGISFLQTLSSPSQIQSFYFPKPTAINEELKSNFVFVQENKLVSLRSDFLWNFKGMLKNKVRFYVGSGITLSSALLKSNKLSNERFSLEIDTSGNFPYLIGKSYISNSDSRSFIHYGISGIAGIKINASCKANFFVEMRKSLDYDNYYGHKTFNYSTTTITFGIRKKLNYYDLIEPPEDSDLTAPPVF
ncbi:MAG: hypothetical protein KBG24_12290 [Bacteroidia bacterium]|nr:hypothetical protein [Bacteroidia bacterium]MBP9181264.1 hypothetical protein [Bacteroidia bacterium]